MDAYKNIACLFEIAPIEGQSGNERIRPDKDFSLILSEYGKG